MAETRGNEQGEGTRGQDATQYTAKDWERMYSEGYDQPKDTSKRDEQRYSTESKSAEEVEGSQFTPPEGSKVVEINAQGKPTVYEKDGVRYYTPDSVMWEKGYRTSKEYIYETVQRDKEGKVISRTGGEARDSGQPAPYAMAKNVSQAVLQDVKRILPEYPKLTQEEQFSVLVNLGYIEPGSRFVGGRGQNFAYYPASELKRTKVPLGKVPPLPFRYQTKTESIYKTVTIPANRPKEERLYGYKQELPKEEKLWGRIESYVEPITIPQAIWRVLTPWVEERNETIKTYIKSIPKRITQLETFEPSQAELEAMYKEEESAPLWAKIIFGPTVVKWPDGHYSTIATGEGPPIGGIKGGLNLARSAPKIVRQVTELPISRPDANKILAAAKNWNKIVEAIKNGAVRNATQFAEKVRLTPTIIEYGGAKTTKATPELEEFIRNVTKATEAARKAEVAQRRIQAVKIAKAYEQAAQSKAAARIATLRAAGKIEAQPWRPVTLFLTKPRMEELLTLWSTMKPNDALRSMLREQMLTVAIASNPEYTIQLLNRASPSVRSSALSQLSVQTRAAVKAKSATEAQTQAIADVQTQTKTKTRGRTETETQTQTYPFTSTETQTKPSMQMKTEPLTLQSTRTPTFTPESTSIPFPAPMRPGTPTSEPPPPLPKRLSISVRQVSGSPMSQPIEAGSIAWKQGWTWVYIPPPWNMDKPLSLPKGVAPTGAIYLGGRTPQETIQMIGHSRTARVPDRITIDRGVTDILILRGGSEIVFAGDGEQTNVGQSIDSTTEGMTLGDVDRAMLSQLEEPILREKHKGVNRPLASKKKPKRKGKHLTEWEYNTTLKGFRP